MDREVRLGIDTTHLFSNKDMQSGKPMLSVFFFMTDILGGMVENGHADQITIYTFRYAKKYFEKNFPGVHVACAGNRIFDVLNGVTRKNIYVKFNMGANIVRTVNKTDVDVFWNPFVRFWRGDMRFKVLGTIHDLEEYHANKSEYMREFNEMSRSCDHLVTISEYVKKDCMETLGFPDSHIDVIYNAVKPKNLKEVPVPGIEPGYILNVNSYRPHKNMISLILAFNKIKDQVPCNLVFCGGTKDYEHFAEIEDVIAKNHLEDRVQLVFAADEAQVEWLYSNARLFANASLGEGFGRSPIEAAYHETPVLTAKSKALYETTFGMVDYIEDPLDTDEIAQRMLQILENGPSYDVREVKETFLKAYDPRTIAARYWEVIEKLAGKTN